MRLVCSALGLGLVLALVGCSNFRFNLLDRDKNTPKPPEPTGAPTVAQLVEYLNANSQRVQTMRCDDVDLNASQGLQLMPGLSGRMVCQGQRFFRMKAGLLGKDQIDLGSNDQEFWFWIRQFDPPHQFHCSYQALEEGKVKVMLLPFQPDWVMETMGLGKYGPAERYELQVEPEKFKLVERTKSPQGKAVRKVIVFNRREARGTVPQITDYQLIDDASNKEICSAKVTEVQVVDRTSLAVIPRRLELRWPEEKFKLTMKLNGVTINQQVPGTAFVRAPMPGVSSYDLATGRLDGTPNSLQRVQGVR